MKGAWKRSEGRSGRSRRGVMLQPVSETEKDNIMNMPGCCHTPLSGKISLREIELTHAFNAIDLHKWN